MAIMTPYERVLAEPGSIPAREALAAAGDPRKPLIEAQLAQRACELRGSGGARGYEDAADAWIKANGRTWAGRVADLVAGYAYHRGLVAEVTVSGERWVEVASELVTLAPIQHLRLVAPLGGLATTLAVPELLQIATITVAVLGKAFGDAEAIAFAKSPLLANIKYADFSRDTIGRAGVEALAASPHLTHARYLCFNGNPVDPTPFIIDDTPVMAPDKWWHIGRPEVAVELEKKFGPRPWLAVPSDESWPGPRDEMAITVASRTGYPRFYAVNDRPVKLVELANGSVDVQVLDFATGNFKSDMSYLSRITDGGDVDAFPTAVAFDVFLTEQRAIAAARRGTAG